MRPLLDIRDLVIRIHLKEGTVHATNGVDLALTENRTLGLVGESGCGKTILARAILRILPPKAGIVGGSIVLHPRAGHSPIDLAALSPRGKEIRKVRGRDIAMIFQEPMVSLSPVHTIGDQIAESFRLHQKSSKKEALNRALDMLRLVGVPEPQRRLRAYPHELSGGLRQRCMIAMALACHPRLLIADEPTTALDVTIQREILGLIRRLQAQLGTAVLMITHDLGIIAETADDVAIMYLGRIVEQAPVTDLFENPKHPYTRGLLGCVPRLGAPTEEELPTIPGSVPDAFAVPPGCPFHPRCSRRIEGICDRGDPPKTLEVAPQHYVACVLFGNTQGRDERMTHTDPEKPLP